MNSKLQQYFPMIRTQAAVLEEIKKDIELVAIWDSWTKAQQQEFLDFCTGNRGVKILYDSFFKEIMDPYTVPERLNDFLSILLGQRVRVVQVLPTDSRLGNETALLSMDIVVQLKDGTLVNVEVQKVGYMFPGERSACYSADLLLRQYHRIKSLRRKTFSYRDVQSVYTIVFFENSPQIFKAYPDTYVHSFKQTSDTGLSLELLQKYMFVPLDIFKDKMHNDGITCKLDAWLAFLSCDSPEDIIQVISRYPEFMPMYEHIYDVCQNIEKVMGMFSKELALMDKNTELYMIDEMQKEIKQLTSERKQLEKEREQLTIEHQQLASDNQQLASDNQQLVSDNQQLVSGNQLLVSDNQQLISDNQQLISDNQQLKLDVQQLHAQIEVALKKIEQLTQLIEH